MLFIPDPRVKAKLQLSISYMARVLLESFYVIRITDVT
jgi:hypothetical protein